MVALTDMDVRLEELIPDLIELLEEFGYDTTPEQLSQLLDEVGLRITDDMGEC